MVVEEVRADVELVSADALKTCMRYRKESTRSLAARVGCSHSVIGFLTSGRRKTIRPEWAHKIEQILDMPPGSLFKVRLTTVKRERPAGTPGKRVA